MKQLYHLLHSKITVIMVPIDDTESGNKAIRKMMGVDDREKFPQYP